MMPERDRRTDDQTTLVDARWDPHQTELMDHNHNHSDDPAEVDE